MKLNFLVFLFFYGFVVFIGFSLFRKLFLGCLFFYFVCGSLNVEVICLYDIFLSWFKGFNLFKLMWLEFLLVVFFFI